MVETVGGNAIMTQLAFNFIPQSDTWEKPDYIAITQTEIQGRAAAQMGCCGVFAVANGFGFDINNAFEWFKKHRKASNNYRGQTSISDRRRFCQAHNIDFKEIKLTRRQRLKTVLQHLDESKNYIITITRHVLIYRDGRIIDQGGSHDVKHDLIRSGDANRIVKSVWEI